MVARSAAPCRLRMVSFTESRYMSRVMSAEGRPMIRMAGLSLLAAAAIAGLCGTATTGKAAEANGAWCQVFMNYNNTGQDVCMAEQFGPDTVTAKFQVSPG